MHLFDINLTGSFITKMDFMDSPDFLLDLS